MIFLAVLSFFQPIFPSQADLVSCVRRVLFDVGGITKWKGSVAEDELQAVMKTPKEFPPEWKKVGPENIQLIIPEKPVIKEIRSSQSSPMERSPHSLRRSYPSFTAKIRVSLPHSKTHEIGLVLPKDYLSFTGEEELLLRERVEKVVAAVAELPTTMVKPIQKIHFSMSSKSGSPTTYASMDAVGEIHFFPQSDPKFDSKRVLLHEAAHLHARALWNSLGCEPKSKAWQEAVRVDDAYVSEYARTSSEEDFAESLSVYLVSNGGRSNPDLRKKFAAKFAFLDALMDPENEHAWQLVKEKYSSRQNLYRLIVASVVGEQVWAHYRRE